MTFSNRRRSILEMIIAIAFAQACMAEESQRSFQVYRTAQRIPFGLIESDNPTTEPAPTLFIVAHGFETMRRQPVYTEVSAILAKRGWRTVIVEPPCHGEDRRENEPEQLEGWRHRLEQTGDFVPQFVEKVQSVIDHVIDRRLSDPHRIAVSGTSRGGWLAYHLAAAEPRFKAVAGISPVTRLTALREFDSTTCRNLAEQLDVANLGSKLANRPVWLSIGNNDLRVNSDDAIAFTRAVVRASARPDLPNAVIPVELLVAPTPGHSKIDQAHELLAAWLLRQFP